MNQQQQQQQPQPQQLQQQQQQHPGGGPNLGTNPLVRPAGPSLVVPTSTKSSTSPSSSSSTAGVGNPMPPSTVTGTAAVGPMLSRGGMTTRARAMGGGSSFDKQSIVYMVRVLFFICMCACVYVYVRVRVYTILPLFVCSRVFSNESSTTASRWLCTMCVCVFVMCGLSLFLCVCVCVFCVCFKFSLYDNNIHSFLPSFIHSLQVLLSVQFGLQPILTRRFTPQGITRSTVVLAQEMTKLVLAGVMLYMTTNGAPIRAGVLRGMCVPIYIYIYIRPGILPLLFYIYVYPHTHYTLSFVSIFKITLSYSHTRVVLIVLVIVFSVGSVLGALSRSLSFFQFSLSLFHSMCHSLYFFHSLSLSLV